MNGHALAFHLLCSLHLILSIITIGKYCPAFFRASVWIFGDEVEVATITIDAVIIDQIAIPIKFDNVSCAMTA